MRLLSLCMYNFRQFYGTSEIIFSKEHEDKNVIVIFGENGRGKTGIFRAIVYCLYNEKKLIQDGDIKDEELQLINTQALEEHAGEFVDSFVELKFVHNNIIYTLKRSMIGSKQNDKVITEDRGTKLLIKYPDGNTKKIEQQNEIDYELSKILDKRIKDYFLFDGERIERLTRANVEQKKEVAIGIKRLLNVDALEKARSALSRLTKQLEKDCADKFSPEYAKLIREINSIELLIQEKNERKREIENELEHAYIEKDKLDKELESINEIKHFIEKRKELETSIADKEQEAKEILSQMKNYPKTIAFGIIFDVIKDVYDYIDKLKAKGQIPSAIRKDLIQKILYEKKCICGNKIEEGDEAYKRIIEWLNNANEQDVQDSILDIWRLLSEILSSYEKDYYDAEQVLIKYGRENNDLERLRIDLEEISRNIGNSNRSDALDLEDCREKLEEKIIKLEAERKYIIDNIESHNKDHIKIQQEIEKEKQKQIIKSVIEKRAILARDTRDALNNTYEKFTAEIKEVVGKYASEIFNKLLDENEKIVLKQIVVNEDYSLQVLDRWNKPFLADISAGQRQIMSIAFIMALAKVAANGGLLEIPLFMDTPFGRLSYYHRKNLINLLPQMASQWVLLATDTEFSLKEANELRNTGLWSKMYILNATDKGNTVIEERDIDSAILFLKDR